MIEQNVLDLMRKRAVGLMCPVSAPAWTQVRWAAGSDLLHAVEEIEALLTDADALENGE